MLYVPGLAITIRLDGDPIDTPKDSSVVLNVIGVAVFAVMV
jgi:hypothetical protein